MTKESAELLNEQCGALLKIFEELNPVQEARKFNLDKIAECIQKMCRLIISDKTECEDFLRWLDEHEFYKSPASTKFHGNWEGGLCVHSLMVCVHALKFASVFAETYLASPAVSAFDFTAEDIVISSIAHDLCKAGIYKVEFHNTKDIFGNWVKKAVYKVKPENRSLGHGNESVLLLLESMPSLIKKRHVIEAVSRHMGFSDITETEKMNYSNFIENPLVLLIQTADQAAAAWWDC